MTTHGDGLSARWGRLPWLSWGTAVLAAYGLKLAYSRATLPDLAWILLPTARAVGWLRGETLVLLPGFGWGPADGSYFIAPACAGVNFLILVLTVSVLGFAHRLRTPRQRLAWWLGSAAGAYLATVAVNALRIVAAVELYRQGTVLGLAPEQLHRLLGVLLYLGALAGIYGVLDRLTAGEGFPLAGALLVTGVYLGMTLIVPLLTGHPGERYAEHAMMLLVMVIVLAALGAATVFLARRVGYGERGTRGTQEKS
jgi:exosortase K